MDLKQVWQQVYDSRQSDDSQRAGQQQTEEHGRILAIDGDFDHWGDVVPHIRASVRDLVPGNADLGDLPRKLEDYHLVAVGCPGSDLGNGLRSALPAYLRSGGYVLTTDWCLGNLLAGDAGWLGPSKVSHAGSSGDARMVEFRLADPAHPLVRGIAPVGRWKVDASSHVVAVKDSNAIKVLLATKNAGESLGDGTLVFTTAVERGTLVHCVSHAYAQETDVQGAQAAVALLANLFDMATAGAVACKGSAWFRLRATDSADIATFKASSGGLAVTRDLAKALFRSVADEAGDGFHRYVSRTAPILEFRFESGRWEARVPAESGNSFLLGSKHMTDSWQPLASGDRLTLFSGKRGVPVSTITFDVEMPK